MNDTAAVAPRPPGLLAASWVLACRGPFAALRGARAVVLGILALVPCLIGLLLVAFGGHDALGVNNFVNFAAMFHLNLLLPLALLFLSAGALGDDQENGTLLYLRLCPIPRPAIIVGRFAGVVASAALLFVPAIAALYLVMVGGRDASLLGEELRLLLGVLGILGLATGVYVALFLWLAVLFKRAILIGIFFVMGWEVTASLVPSQAARYTVSFHAQALIAHLTPEGRAVQERLAPFRAVDLLPSWQASVIGMCVATLLLLLLAGYSFERKEYLATGPEDT